MLFEERGCSRSASPATTAAQMFAPFHPGFDLVTVGFPTIQRSDICPDRKGMGRSSQNPVSTKVGWIRRWTNELGVRVTRETPSIRRGWCYKCYVLSFHRNLHYLCVVKTKHLVRIVNEHVETAKKVGPQNSPDVHVGSQRIVDLSNTNLVIGYGMQAYFNHF